MENVESPIHEHDCDCCHFLGSHNGEDLYFHPGKHWTLISRYGKHGDYQSGPHISQTPQLIKARELAVVAGYITAEQTH